MGIRHDRGGIGQYVGIRVNDRLIVSLYKLKFFHVRHEKETLNLTFARSIKSKLENTIGDTG